MALSPPLITLPGEGGRPRLGLTKGNRLAFSPSTTIESILINKTGQVKTFYQLNQYDV